MFASAARAARRAAAPDLLVHAVAAEHAVCHELGRLDDDVAPALAAPLRALRRRRRHPAPARRAPPRSEAGRSCRRGATLHCPSGKVSTTRPTLERAARLADERRVVRLRCAHCGNAERLGRRVEQAFTPTSRFSSCASNPGSITIEFVRSMIPCASAMSRTLRPYSSSSTPDQRRRRRRPRRRRRAPRRRRHSVGVRRVRAGGRRLPRGRFVRDSVASTCRRRGRPRGRASTPATARRARGSWCHPRQPPPPASGLNEGRRPSRPSRRRPAYPIGLMKPPWYEAMLKRARELVVDRREDRHLRARRAPPLQCATGSPSSRPTSSPTAAAPRVAPAPQPRRSAGEADRTRGAWSGSAAAAAQARLVQSSSRG